MASDPSPGHRVTITVVGDPALTSSRSSSLSAGSSVSTGSGGSAGEAASHHQHHRKHQSLTEVPSGARW